MRRGGGGGREIKRYAEMCCGKFEEKIGEY
jgi:hypothetical protein